MQKLKISFVGDSDLTRDLLAMAYEHGHEIAVVVSDNVAVRAYADQNSLRRSCDIHAAADWVVIVDLPKSIETAPNVQPCLACVRHLEGGRDHYVDWHVVNDGITLRYRLTVSGPHDNGADALWACGQAASAEFGRILVRLTRRTAPLVQATAIDTFQMQRSTDLHRMAAVHRANAGAVRFKHASSLVSEFATAVQRYADHIALEFAGRAISYAELDRLSDRLAAALVRVHSERGIQFGVDRRIGVALSKSLELYVAILAVLKTGAAYVPLDPAYPIERLRWMSSDAALDVVLAASDMSEQFGPKILGHRVDLAALTVESTDAAWHAPAIDKHALAVVIYTSGSTGRPKGVMLEHRNIVHFCSWYRRHVELTVDSVALQFSTVSFDASLLDIFPVWFAGGRLVVPSESVRHSFDELAELMRRSCVTHAFLPPAWLAGMPENDLEMVEHLVTGGDVCDPDTISRWSRNRHFHNIYGPTECTVLVTTSRFHADSSNRDIGKPISNTRCYVLREDGIPTRTGEVGELFVASPGLGRGYLGQDELTRERFLPDPFEPGELMYKTGDQVRWTQHGTLDFVGRIDTQIKLRGFRIELGEIESAVLATGLYKHAAVVATEAKLIIAYVADPAGGDTSAYERLKQALGAQMPAYMVPSAIIEVEALPATANGKIDRRALAARPVRWTQSREGIVKPGNAVETRLASIWAQVLKLDQSEIGIEDSFFDLGGHSLLVSRMLLAVKKTMARNMALARFMENPTIASLASLIQDDRIAKGARIPARVFDDAVLPEDLQPLPRANPRRRRPRAVLLTGANGFLGCFILEQLVRHTDAELFCLVRAKDDIQAQVRMNGALTSFGLTSLIGQLRIHALAGDFAKPRLGMTEERYITLCQQVDVIYHNGANVNHVYDYGSLYDANVASTVALLRLATTGINKALHFVSTLSAASHINDRGELLETAPADTPPAFINNGYNLTKWVSERLVWQAQKVGIDTVIYRPGNITGESRHGICQPERNRILLLIKGSLQLGVMPRWNMGFDLSPVDYLARAIVKLSLSDSTRRVHHLHNPKPLSWVEYVSALRQFGYCFEFVEPRDWRARLLQIDESNALFDVISFYLDDENEDIGDMGHIHWLDTAAELQRLNIDYPDKNARLLKSHFGYLIEAGFLPALPTPRNAACTPSMNSDAVTQTFSDLTLNP